MFINIMKRHAQSAAKKALQRVVFYPFHSLLHAALVAGIKYSYLTLPCLSFLRTEKIDGVSDVILPIK